MFIRLATELKVAFTLRRITRRKMVVYNMIKIFFILQMAKSMVYYAANMLCVNASLALDLEPMSQTIFRVA